MGLDPPFIWSIRSGSGPVLLPWVPGPFNIMCYNALNLHSV